MLGAVIHIELLKHKRTIMPWFIIFGGLLPAVTSFLIITSERYKAGWEVLAQTFFNNMNLTALLLTTVFSGTVFIGEYRENVVSTLFVYPIPRLKFFIGKLVVLLLMLAALYAVHFVSMLALGFMYVKSFPSAEMLMRISTVSLLAVVVNFTLIPLTVLISSTIKLVAASVITGMGYAIVYMLFINSKISSLVPPCIPVEAAAAYLSGSVISSKEITGMIISLLITFTIPLFISVLQYCKSDVYY
jgi:hypothetical protein